MKILLRFTTLLFLVFCTIQNSYSQQNTNGWYWINSRPQSNNLNWTQIVNATNYYAVGDEGTFMKSSDGGDTWLINTAAGIIDPLFGSGGTYRLNTGWFFDANTGLVAGQSASGDGGFVRRTTDGGNTFTSIGLGASSGVPRISDIYFMNSTTGYLCGNNSVKAYKTTNAGLNWTPLPNLPVSTSDYSSIYAINENNILIGLNTDGTSRHIYRTTNAGATWIDQTLPGTVIEDFDDIQFQNSTTGFIGGNPSYFAYTTDAGANWTQAIFPNNQQGISKIKIIGSTVYTLGSYYSLYYTSNLGVTWDSVNFSDPSNLNQPFPFIVNDFDINGSNQIVVGYNGKVTVSNDGGNSWRNKNYSVGNVNLTFPCIFALPGTTKVWAGGTGGLILYSSNSGTNWTKQQTSAPYGFYDIKMLNSNTGYACGGLLIAGAGYVFKTTNGGNSWLQIPLSIPNTPLYDLDFIDANTGWIFGGYPFGSPPIISRTTNGGVSWTNQTSTPVLDGTVAAGSFKDANTGYFTYGSNLFKTTNGGTNWNIFQTFAADLYWSVVQCLPGNTVYLGGNRRVLKSFDGGNTWDTVYIPADKPNIFNMDWYDQNNGTVVGTAGYSAKTRDGGITWTERNPGSSTLTGVSMSAKDTVFASCDRNVYGAIFRLYDFNTTININLTVGIQGFWNGSVQVSDTVKCHLRNASAPYNEVEAVSAVLNNSGSAVFGFNSTPSGLYYIEITHRNSLETWSASPQLLSAGGTLNYNFTTAASQAYGNNIILTSGRYCDYSGDVTQEGSVDLNDVVDVNNASSVFTTGYVVQDVTGDNLVDLSDLIITFNNASLFVTSITP
ncbi:MAG TPA: YCF48-related protein [Ignavibacteria bacterium]|nr:YCF48-related protein [Ignavibacteria bacterium]